MRMKILFVLGLLFTTSAFSQETVNKRIICSIKDFSAASLGKDRLVDASDVGLQETPKELIIPADAEKTDDDSVFAWESLGGIRQRVGYAFRFLDYCVVDVRRKGTPQLF